VDYETEGSKTTYSMVHDQLVRSSRGTITSALAPCSHEEADSRIFVHVKDMAQQGHTKMMIRTVDTDVVVIAVAKFLQIGLEELWVAFGTGKNYRHIEVHQIVSRIGGEKSKALAFSMHLQAATRCHSCQTMGRSLLGRHGRHILRLQTPSTHCVRGLLTYLGQ